ncbi:MAG: 5-bromo-4-chloroindolyl phosphate hydrolysis family protein [Paracoccaceae bacterium]|nr:5-bromo-4-chloroindolyl phosphate hydrolysis family protein [Paracoccaceae bacterium]
MAERYGGKYSPGGASGPAKTAGATAARRTKAGFRANLLFVAPFPLVIKAFFSEPIVLGQYLGAWAILMLAAWLTREGLKAEEAYEARKIAKRPAIPRKGFGSLLTGAGLGLAGLAGFGMPDAAIFALFGAGLHFFAFGPDPMRDKGATGIDQMQSDRVARAVDEAEKHLSGMTEAIKRAREPQLERRVESFQATARQMFRSVENDPRDLVAARRYLGVYLLGAKDATVKFADLYAQSRNAEARADYLALLDDLEQSFAQRTEKLLLDDKSGLDIEIEVLRERLAREGVRHTD